MFIGSTSISLTPTCKNRKMGLMVERKMAGDKNSEEVSPVAKD